MRTITQDATARKPSGMDRALASILEGLRALVKEELAAAGAADPDPIQPHTEWPIPRRSATRAAKHNDSASKRGRVWYARRSCCPEETGLRLKDPSFFGA